MTIKTTKRNVGPLSMRGTVATVDDARRTVDVVFATSTKVLRNSFWDGPSYEELSLDPRHVRMGRLQNGAPFLSDHNARLSSVLGVVESARLENGKGIATIRFAKAEDDAEADKIYRKVKDGILTSVSVGYRTYATEKVEGGDAKIPTFRSTDWEPYEISAVALPADAAAGFRDAGATDSNECNFLSRSTGENEMDLEEIKRQAAAAEAMVVAQRAALEAATLQARKLERERVSGITAAFRSFGEKQQAHAAKLAEFCAGEVSLDAARVYVLDELAKASDATPTEQHTKIERGADDTDQFVRGVTDAMLQRGGNEHIRLAIEKKVAGFDKLGDGGQYRGATLSDIARICLQRAGVKGVDRIYDRQRLAEMALMQRNGYATPSDFPVLMEDIARKSMRAGYAVQAETWRRWMGTDSVSNFLASSRFQKGSFAGPLPVVTADGEYTNIELPDGAKISISTETRGAIIAMGRHMIVNDDLGAFTSVASDFGAMAGKSIELSAYEQLALNSGLGPTMSDSQAFFHANRNNVVTSAALTAAALDLDRLHMRTQENVSGTDFLDLYPSILLIPVGLETAAKLINSDAYDPTQVGQRTNIARGLFADIVASPRLTASTTRRYLFTDRKDAFKCVFLDGAGEGPTLSSQEGFRRDGMEFKARIDFKVNPYDPQSAVTNAGT